MYNRIELTHTIRLDATISPDRHVEFILPDDFPVGEASVVLTVTPKDPRRKSTARDLLESDIVGMWADRTDIGDSDQFVRKFREEVWKRAE